MGGEAWVKRGLEYLGTYFIYLLPVWSQVLEYLLGRSSGVTLSFTILLPALFGDS